VLIDPGAEAGRLIDFIAEKKLMPKFIINTHCHIDHTAEVSVIQHHFNIPFYIHKREKTMLDSIQEQGRYFGISVSEKPVVTRFLADEDTLELNAEILSIIHTPGHSPGGIAIKSSAGLFVGDTLFRDSIGRTDLPGGSYEDLIGAIKEKLLSLDDELPVYPGHGPATTIGRERRMNPFLTIPS
jgi:glyoxylase-like metal-dependent hydrolase (beta-lactamase superfamily II)